MEASAGGAQRADGLRQFRYHWLRALNDAFKIRCFEPKIDGAPADEYVAGVMEAIAEKLETRLHEWRPETSERVRALVAEIIEAADDDTLDIGRSRAVEQEVLDILDAPPGR
jgi:hypothetical protein